MRTRGAEKSPFRLGSTQRPHERSWEFSALRYLRRTCPFFARVHPLFLRLNMPGPHFGDVLVNFFPENRQPAPKRKLALLERSVALSVSQSGCAFTAAFRRFKAWENSGD